MKISRYRRCSTLVERCAVILMLAICSAPAIADDEGIHPLLESKYWLSVGAYFAARDLDISAQGEIDPVAPTTLVDFESSVGVDDKPELVSIEAGWRMNENWRLQLQHFSSDRSGSRTIDEQIEWDGLVFDIGANVYGRSNFDITRAFFSREFRSKGPHSLQLGAGLHYVKMDVEYGGEATLGDGSTSFDSSRKSTSAPVPNIGATYRYSPSEKWLFLTRVDWFSANLGDIKGGMWNASAGAYYSLTNNFGLALTYQFFELDVSLRENLWTGDVRARFGGPNLQLNAYW